MNKRLIYVLIGIVVIHLGYDILATSNLNDALQGMDTLSDDLKVATQANQSAKAQTNEILQVVKAHRAQLLRLEQGVAQIDLTRQDNEQRFLAERRLLRKEIEHYNRLLDSMKQQLPMNDTTIIWSDQPYRTVSTP
jgi:hypothetical protein